MTITQQQIIALAVEAGFDDITPWLDAENVEQGQIDAANRWIERMTAFAALVSAKENQARIKLKREFMEYQNDMQARGTRLIKEAYQRGVCDERNACLAEIETGIWMDKTTEEVLAEIAEAIRARGEPCRFCNGTGERDSGGSQPWGAAIMVECECQQSDDAYHRGVRDEREACAKVCEEIAGKHDDSAECEHDQDFAMRFRVYAKHTRRCAAAIRARSAETKD